MQGEMIRSWSKLMILPASSMSRYDLERDISTRKNRPTYPQKRPTYPQKRSASSMSRYDLVDLFCGYVGLFCGYVGLFLRVFRSLSPMFFG